MNKSIVVLSLSTAAFAASTAYLAHELYLRETRKADSGTISANAGGRPDISLPTTSSTGPNTPDLQAQLARPATTDAVRPAGQAAGAATASPRDAQAEAGAAFARQFLDRYDDAGQRSALLEETRSVIRRQYAKLKQQLKLSDTAFEQLATLIAEEQLQAQETWARCAVDAACDPRNLRGRPHDDRSLEYAALLDTQDHEAFTQFRNSIGERDAVIQLRGRLPDSSFLPEEQAEKLIAALSEERERFSREATERGAKISGWGTPLGMLWYTEDSGLPDQYVVEASQYSQRLRARAAAILTPAQLAAYAEMQAELLAQFTANLRPPARQNKPTAARSG